MEGVLFLFKLLMIYFENFILSTSNFSKFLLIMSTHITNANILFFIQEVKITCKIEYAFLYLLLSYIFYTYVELLIFIFNL